MWRKPVYSVRTVLWAISLMGFLFLLSRDVVVHRSQNLAIQSRIQKESGQVHYDRPNVPQCRHSFASTDSDSKARLWARSVFGDPTFGSIKTIDFFASPAPTIWESTCEIRSLAAIRSYDFHITRSYVGSLASCGNVGCLEFCRCTFDEDSLHPIATMKNLRVLSLLGTGVSLLHQCNLGELSRLEVLQLAGMPIDSAAGEEIESADGLKVLSLAICSLSEQPVTKWPVNLESLILSGVNISDSDIPSITQCVHLKQLDLTFTNITDAGVIELKTCSNLTDLVLTDTNVTRDAVIALSKELSACNIYWDGARDGTLSR